MSTDKSSGPIEPIRGQGISLFWASDREGTYTAYTVVVYHCGKCGIALDQHGWPSRCKHGHLNVREG